MLVDQLTENVPISGSGSCYVVLVSGTMLKLLMLCLSHSHFHFVIAEPVFVQEKVVDHHSFTVLRCVVYTV